MAIYKQEFEPFADIGFDLLFTNNTLNTQNGKQIYYEVTDIATIPEYYLQFIQNSNTTPVISSIPAGGTAVYFGNDLELEANQLGQWRFTVNTSGITISLQQGRGGQSLYKTKGQTGLVDANLASSLYQFTEFYTFANRYPAFQIQNNTGAVLTSAYITITGYIFTLDIKAGVPSVKRYVPLHV